LNRELEEWKSKGNNNLESNRSLEEELKIFWDKLPIDTVIASVLDPRTKKYHKIPPHEINEAVKIIKSV